MQRTSQLLLSCLAFLAANIQAADEASSSADEKTCSIEGVHNESREGLVTESLHFITLVYSREDYPTAKQVDNTDDESTAKQADNTDDESTAKQVDNTDDESTAKQAENLADEPADEQVENPANESTAKQADESADEQTESTDEPTVSTAKVETRKGMFATFGENVVQIIGMAFSKMLAIFNWRNTPMLESEKSDESTNKASANLQVLDRNIEEKISIWKGGLSAIDKQVELFHLQSSKNVVEETSNDALKELSLNKYIEIKLVDLLDTANKPENIRLLDHMLDLLKVLDKKNGEASMPCCALRTLTFEELKLWFEALSLLGPDFVYWCYVLKYVENTFGKLNIDELTEILSSIAGKWGLPKAISEVKDDLQDSEKEAFDLIIPLLSSQFERLRTCEVKMDYQHIKVVYLRFLEIYSKIVKEHFDSNKISENREAAIQEPTFELREEITA